MHIKIVGIAKRIVELYKGHDIINTVQTIERGKEITL